MKQFKYKLWIDTETFSETPISRGTDVYANGSNDGKLAGVEVMIIAYALNNGVIKVVDLTEGALIPQELYDALMDDDYLVIAHNAFFDRKVLRVGLGLDIPIWRWHCTMAQAYAHSLPAGLGLLCQVLNVKTKKQENGRQLINLFCKPRPKRQKIRRATRDTHPEEWSQFLSYGGDDVGAMRDCYYAMPIRNYVGDEKELWELDQRMNDRGFATDTEFAHAAIRLLKEDKKRNDARVNDLTKGDVTAATQRDKFMLHMLNEHGVLLDSLRADDLEELLEDERLPIVVRELLQLRIMSAMNSTAKYTRLMNCVSSDGRLRGTRQYNGASRTGRSAGRIFNPLNLRRPTMKADDINTCIELIKEGDADNVTLFADSLREACSNALRGLVIAPPGKKLVISDWSNIEGRMAAWLTGENWKLQAFADFDTIIGVDENGKPVRAGPDLYKLIYHKSFGTPIEDIDDFLRQIGKGEELSLQYGGGVGAFIAVSYSYGLDLAELGRVMPNLAPFEAIHRARKIWEWACEKGRTLGLEEDVYVACETVKTLYRQANPNIVQGWADLELAAKMAVSYPGEKYTACRCEFQCKANWLMVRLPSGRHLMYPSPRIMANNSLTYAGQVNKQWRRIKTYGGKLLENITQAASRDVLTHNMLRLEREYQDDAQLVLDVYDEVVLEAEEHGRFNIDVLNKMLIDNPPWAAGLPLAAEGFETQRYAKH
jgi:DNA polymerase